MNANDIASIFQRILEVPHVALDDDFFMLGGDSLLVTRVISAIARACGVELSVTDVMSAPTPEALMHHLSQQVSA
jgi:acyl carrier protein